MDATIKEKFDTTLQLNYNLLCGSIRVDDILGNAELTEIEQIIKEEKEKNHGHDTCNENIHQSKEHW